MDFGPEPSVIASVASPNIAYLPRRVQWCAALIWSLFALFSQATAAPLPRSITLSWAANTEADIAGYKLHYGTASGVYDQAADVGNTTSATISNLASDTAYFFVITAYNIIGLESTPSTEINIPPNNASNNADLSSLALSTGTLTPVFASGTVSYTTSVPHATASLALTPTPADGAATVTVNGVDVTPGSASPSIALSVGSNTLTTVVTAQDGTTIKTYTIAVTRAASAPGSFTLSYQAPVWDTNSPAAPAVQLNWTSSSNATSYDLYRNGSLYLSGLTGTASYNKAGLASGQSYTYYVIAKNPVGTRQSNTITVGPMPGAPPTAPGAFTLGNAAPYWNSATNAPAVNLTWTTSSGATSYDVYRNGGLHASGVTQLSFLDNSNLTGGQSYTYHVVAKNAAGTKQSNSVAVTMLNGPNTEVAARMVSPGTGSTLTSSAVTFTWDAGTGVSQYYLTVGTYLNGSNLYSGGETGTNRNRTLSNLPDDGRTIYATLYSVINGLWQPNNYTYTAYTAPPAIKAKLTSPAPNGSVLPLTTTATFTWDAGRGVSQYYLLVGSSLYGGDLYRGSETGGTRTRIINLPLDGRRIFVTLYSVIKGAWHASNYYFDTSSGLAQITDPADASTLPGATATFNWNAGTGVTQYQLLIGTSPRASDICFATETGTNRTRTVTNLPTDGAPVYVTLNSLLSGAWTWKSDEVEYTAAFLSAPTLKARLTAPAPNESTLTSASTTFDWDAGAGVSSYYLTVGSTLNGADLYSGSETGSNRTRTVTVPADGRQIFVTLYSVINGAWKSSGYLFQAPLGSAVPAQMLTPVDGSVFTGSGVTFTWNTGAGATQYMLSAGTTLGGSDLYSATQDTNTTRTLTVPATGSPIYVTLNSLINGVWRANSYVYQAFTPP